MAEQMPAASDLQSTYARRMSAIETDRLVIRPPVEADRARFVDMFTDEAFMVFSGGVHDVYSANARFNRMLALVGTVPYWKQPVVEKATGTIVGYTGVETEVIDGVDRLEWGWRFVPEARGRGYATEATTALLDLADGRRDGELVCIVAADNVPSRRVAEKVGFRWWKRIDWDGDPSDPTDLLIRVVGAGGPPLLAPGPLRAAPPAGVGDRGPGRLVVITGLPGSGKTNLAKELVASMPAVRMCPDDWMTSAGIDLWSAEVRGRIEGFQFGLAMDLLRGGTNVVIEWGVWAREERDALRDAARSIGASVELRYLEVPIEELWRRIDARDRDGRWAARPITRAELDEWSHSFQPPTEDELQTYDPPAGSRAPGARRPRPG